MALPGSQRWVDGTGDCKSDVLIRYRIHKRMEALHYDDMERQSKAKGKR